MARQWGGGKCSGEEGELEERHTPGCETIADLCQYLGCTPRQTLKSVFFMADEQPVLALIRGDLDVNPHKLSKILGTDVQTLSAEEAERFGLSVGYTGPVGLRTAARFGGHDSVRVRSSVACANRPGYHLTGVRYDGISRLISLAISPWPGGSALHRAAQRWRRTECGNSCRRPA